jgi:predicted ATPase
VIHKLRLSNFKAFRNQEFEFAPLTLLCGPNAVGKSSVIQSLLALRQSYEQGAIPGHHLSLDGELVHLGTPQDVLCEGAQTDVVEIEIHWTEGHTLDLAFGLNRDVGLLLNTLDSGESSTFGESLFHSSFRYLTAERLGPRTSMPASIHMVRTLDQIGPNGEFAWHYLAAHGSSPANAPIGRISDQNSASLLKQVEHWMHAISPGIRFSFTEHAQTHGIDVISLGVSFERSASVTNRYRPTNVGFGVSYALPIFVCGLSLHANGLFLLENPEAHLHPQGQSHLGVFLAVLAAAGIQVVVETHSDHVLNGVRRAVKSGRLRPEDCIIQFITPEEGRSEPIVTPIRLSAKGEATSWPKGFFDQMDDDLKVLLS